MNNDTDNSTPHLLLVTAGIALGAGGTFWMLGYLGEGVKTMEGQHWVMLVVILVAGYVLGRLMPGPGQMVGLP